MTRLTIWTRVRSVHRTTPISARSPIDDRGKVSECVGNLLQLSEPGDRCVQPPFAMIGQHDRIGAALPRPHGIAHGQNDFYDERAPSGVHEYD